MLSLKSANLEQNKQIEFILKDATDRISELKNREWRLTNYAVLTLGAFFVLATKQTPFPSKILIGALGVMVCFAHFHLTTKTSEEFNRQRGRLWDFREGYFNPAIVRQMKLNRTREEYTDRYKCDLDTLLVIRGAVAAALVILWVNILFPEFIHVPSNEPSHWQVIAQPETMPQTDANCK